MDKTERLELILRYVSNIAAVLTFWGVVLIFTIWYPHVLGWFERLSLGAALSWAAFTQMEVVGLLIMTFYKEKWQKEAREVGREEGRKEGIAVGIAEGREAGRAEARAEYEETIRRLERRLRERANGDGGNGAEGGA